MSHRKNAYDIEVFRRTSTWAEQIVTRDHDYMDYAGAPLEIGHRLAVIDIAIKYLISDKDILDLLKLYRAYLIQEKKAFFSGVLANQITMLAFLKGGKVREIDAILNKRIKPEIPKPDSSLIQATN
jgi:hypothetical protein